MSDQSRPLDRSATHSPVGLVPCPHGRVGNFVIESPHSPSVSRAPLEPAACLSRLLMTSSTTLLPRTWDEPAQQLPKGGFVRRARRITRRHRMQMISISCHQEGSRGEQWAFAQVCH